MESYKVTLTIDGILEEDVALILADKFHGMFDDAPEGMGVSIAIVDEAGDPVRKDMTH